MKAVAAETADSTFPLATVEIEQEVAGRWADVCVTFPETCYPFGDGICLECQYKNKQKDINGVEEVYASEGYSTLWLFEEQFDDYTVDFHSGTLTKGWLKEIPEPSEWSGVADVSEMWPRECDNFNYSEQETTVRMPSEWFREQLKISYERGLRITRPSSHGSPISYTDFRLDETGHLPEKFHEAVWKISKASERLPSDSERKLSRVEYRLYDEGVDLHCVGDSREHFISAGSCVHCDIELWRLQRHLDANQFHELTED